MKNTRRNYRFTGRTAQKLEAIAASRKASETEVIEDLIEKEFTRMDEKDPNKVYWCSAQGHFWRWRWTDQDGGYWFPAFVPDQEVPEDFKEKYCGCND